jgi:glycosyltransferase involved in cell wall biosynthesis
MGPARPLRIGHVTATFPPYRGGTGNVAWHNARELARLGHEVHVFTADRGGETLAPEGVRVHRLRPFVRVGNAPLLPALLPALRGFDLLHLHYPFFFGAELVWAASRLFGTPYVVTYHNDVELQGLLQRVPAIHQRLVGCHVLSGAGRLLFTTLDYGRSSHVADLVTRPTTGELPNGVDIERFNLRVDGSEVRRGCGATADDVLALFVGGLDSAHYFKGLSPLFRAVRQAACPALRLLVVGDGDLRPKYEREVAVLGLQDRVRFVGRVSDERLPACYAAADLVVLPSVTRGEAFGMVLLEAMAVGKPVLASDLPGVRAVLRRTGGGALVPPSDVEAWAAALVEWVNDRQRRVEYGAAGRQAVAGAFAWPRIGEQLDGLYRELLATGAPLPQTATSGAPTP